MSRSTSLKMCWIRRWKSSFLTTRPSAPCPSSTDFVIELRWSTVLLTAAPVFSSLRRTPTALFDVIMFEVMMPRFSAVDAAPS